MLCDAELPETPPWTHVLRVIDAGSGVECIAAIVIARVFEATKNFGVIAAISHAPKFRATDNGEHVGKVCVVSGLFRYAAVHVLRGLGVFEQLWSLNHWNIAARTASRFNVEVTVNVFRIRFAHD
jgi:hypothetical protein